MNGRSKRPTLEILLPFVVIVAVLHLAREFLIPLALAILLSFLLAPLIRRLERLGLPRVPSVLMATLLAVLAVVGAGVVIGGQLIDLANELPKYQGNLETKIDAFKAPHHGPLANTVNSFRAIAEEITRQPSESQGGAGSPGTGSALPAGETSTSKKPAAPVYIVSGPTNPLTTIKTYAEPLLAPLGTAALVLLLVIFFLLEREDMRDRMIHIVGRSHLQVTTQAIDEAGGRVSRYLLAQLMVNICYGIPITIGLYFIGLPNVLLWGVLATLLRFIPYIGTWIGVAFPVLLAMAISPGWRMPAMTFGLYVVVELTVANAVEPFLYGSSTGMSPIAVIASATFWTWLWGGIGLLLSTPLTVCIAVLGRHIPSLTFLDVLLGDKPPIAQEDRLYQRLLARDEEEICDLLEKSVAATSLGGTFEELVIPTLRAVDRDFRAGSLSEDDRCALLAILHSLVTDLEPAAAPPTVVNADSQVEEGSLTIIPARNLGDETAGMMLSRLLAQGGAPSVVIPSKLLTGEMLAEAEKSLSRKFCISVIPAGSTRQAVYITKRLKERFPDCRVIIGMWGEEEGGRSLERIQHAPLDVVFTKITQAAKELAAAAPTLDSAAVAAAPPSPPTTAAG